jgi:hypothetical protein
MIFSYHFINKYFIAYLSRHKLYPMSVFIVISIALIAAIIYVIRMVTPKKPD